MVVDVAHEAAESDVKVGSDYRPNRKLQPEEVVELVVAYNEGASARELAVTFGLHRHTIVRRLRAAGVMIRPAGRMDSDVLATATALYADGMSTVQIGKELGLGVSTVGKALKRSGVVMRAPVADRWKNKP